MVSLKALYSSNHFYKLLKHQNPLQTSSIYLSTFSNVQETTNSTAKSLLPISFFQRKFSSCAQLLSEEDVPEGEKIEKKGALEEVFIDSKLKEKITELKKKVQKLEKEVGSLKGNVQSTEKKKISLQNEENPIVQSKPTSLYAIFTAKPYKNLKNSRDEKRHVVSKKEQLSSNVKNSSDEKRPIVSKKEQISSNVKSDEKGPVVSKKVQVSSNVKPRSVKKENPTKKELSLEMVALVNRWYEEGYLNKENFPSTKEFDPSSLADDYSCGFLRFTAEKFGQDHQDTAKWLSGSDLKTVALNGCPSVEKKSVFAAKRLRTFFNIQEDIVCRGCKLKCSCKFVNQKVWGKMDNLNLVDAMRILTSYSLDSAPQLAIPTEVKVSINKLLKEVVNLSQ